MTGNTGTDPNSPRYAVRDAKTGRGCRPVGTAVGVCSWEGAGADQRLRLWRARFRSFFFLCFRIFLRRFLMTLPKTPPVGRR